MHLKVKQTMLFSLYKVIFEQGRTNLTLLNPVMVILYKYMSQ